MHLNWGPLICTASERPAAQLNYKAKKGEAHFVGFYFVAS